MGRPVGLHDPGHLAGGNRTTISTIVIPALFKKVAAFHIIFCADKFLPFVDFGFRIPWPQRRWQDYNAEAAHGIDLPNLRFGAPSGPRLDRPGSKGANWISSRATLFLRSPDRARAS